MRGDLRRMDSREATGLVNRPKALRFLTDQYFEGLLIPCNCKLFATRYKSRRRGYRMAVQSMEGASGESGWRRPRGTPSLSEVFGSIRTQPTGSFWQKLVAFLGPGYLVAVGYMDPGNWATS